MIKVSLNLAVIQASVGSNKSYQMYIGGKKILPSGTLFTDSEFAQLPADEQRKLEMDRQRGFVVIVTEGFGKTQSVTNAMELDEPTSQVVEGGLDPAKWWWSPTEKIYYIFDGTTWLSSELFTYVYNKDKVDGAYLDPSYGLPVYRKARIKYLEAHAISGDPTKGFEIQVGTYTGSFITKYSFNLASFAYSDFNVNVDIAPGEIVRVFAVSGGLRVDNIRVIIKLCWRR